MELTQKQLKRLLKIIEIVRRGRYPTITDIRRELEHTTYDLTEQHNLEASRYTVMRDIKLLKQTYRCPIEFNVAQQGYELTDPAWDFVYPVTLNETEMMAMQIGRRVCENVFPEPLRSNILNTVDYLLNVGNPEMASASFVKQMHFISAKTGKVDKDIFSTVFLAWRNHRMLSILYKNNKDEITQRIIEPHALFFRNSTWYIQAFCHERKKRLSFMIHRIQRAELGDDHFVPNPEIYEHISFDFTLIKNIVLRFHKSVHDDIFANPFHEAQEILWETEDPLYKIVKIPEAEEQIIVPRIMAKMGAVTVIEPAELRQKVIDAATSLIAAQQKEKPSIQ